MNKNTMNSTAVDRAAGALIHALASAMAADLDTALGVGYGEMLRIVTAFSTNSRRVNGNAATSNR